MRLGVEAHGPHESKRLCDSIGELLVALGLGAVLDEAEHPTMDILKVSVAAGGERPEQVQGGRGLPIGFELPARIGLARLWRELDVVDDVPPVGRQGDAVDGLEVRGARLGELAGDATDLDDRRGCRERHDHRHLQKHPEEIADIVGGMLSEALGAVPTLQQERRAVGRLAQRLLELARLAGEDERRIAGKLAFDVGKRSAVAVNRSLRDGLRAPTLRGPTLVSHHACLNDRLGAASRPPSGLYTDRRFQPIC